MKEERAATGGLIRPQAGLEKDDAGRALGGADMSTTTMLQPLRLCKALGCLHLAASRCTTVFGTVTVTFTGVTFITTAACATIVYHTTDPLHCPHVNDDSSLGLNRNDLMEYSDAHLPVTQHKAWTV